MENIYRVTQVKLNQLVKEMSTRSLTYQQSVFKRYDSDKHCQSFYVKMAAKINWHRYGTKLDHCAGRVSSGVHASATLEETRKASSRSYYFIGRQRWRYRERREYLRSLCKTSGTKFSRKFTRKWRQLWLMDRVLVRVPGWVNGNIAPCSIIPRQRG